MNDKLKKRASFFMASTLIATSIPTEVIADDINTETQKTAKESTQIKKDIDNEEISNPTNIHSTSDMDIAPKNNNENDDIEENVIIKESDTIDDDQKKVNSNTKDNTESDTIPKRGESSTEEIKDTNNAENPTIDQHTDDEIADVPCENLRRVINEHLNRGLITDPVTVKDIESIQGSFDAKRMGITSLKGLEHAKNISSIYISSNKVSDITPLQNLTHLEVISLSDNKVEDITPLQNLTRLTLLDLSGNKVSNITPLEKLVNLSSLNLSKNQISNITPLGNLIDLLSLDLSNNQISDITSLGNLINLSSLDLSNNQISDITPLKNTTNLAGINLSNNQVSNITPLQNNMLLNIINLGNNQISDLSTLENFIILREADLSNNQISNIDTLKNTMTLYSLNLNNNQISDITPIKDLVGLGHLYLNNNNISDLTPLANLNNLQTLSLKNQTNSSSESTIEVEDDTFNMTYNLKNVDGQLLTNITFPSDNSANGRLEGNNIIWDGLKPGSNKVKFTISESVKVGQITTPFTYTASYDINFTQQEELITDWTYENYENGIRLISYIGSSNDIVIPGEIAGKQIYITKETLTSLKDKNSITINEQNDKKVILTGSKDLTRTFYQGKLKTADLSGLDVTGITSMKNMFSSCSNLISISLSNWDTSKVTTAAEMFLNCSSLTTIDTTNWNLSNLQNANWMFGACSKLTTLDTSTWNLSNLQYAVSMFVSCSSLTTLDTSNWKLSNLISAEEMFYRCSNLTTIDTSSWDTSNIEDANCMFDGCSSLTTIDTSNWDTSSLKYASCMFNECSSLTTIDTSNWDTSNLENTSWMFYGCSSLTNVDASNWDTSSLKDIREMYANCINLETVDMSRWQINEGTRITGLFLIEGDQTSETNLLVIAKDPTLINYDYKGDGRSGSKITLDANGGIFSNDSSIKESDELFVIEAATQEKVESIVNNLLETPTKEGHTFKNWETSTTENDSIYDKLNATYTATWEENIPEELKDWTYEKYEDGIRLISYIGSSNDIVIPGEIAGKQIYITKETLTSLKDKNSITINEVGGKKAILAGEKNLLRTFYAGKIKSVDLRGLDVTGITSMNNMFRSCPNLTSVNMSGWDTSKVTTTYAMFAECPKLTTVNANNWILSSLENAEYTFYKCSSLTTLDITNWNLSNVTDAKSMFYECSSLTTVDTANWNLSRVKNTSFMFYGCSSLTTLDTSNWNLSNVTDAKSMFYECSSLTTVDTANWNLSRVKNTSFMFYGCSNLTTLDTSNWSLSSLQDANFMFLGCSSLTTLDTTNWNLSNLESSYSMFSGCFRLTTLDTTNWNLSKLIDADEMFSGCFRLTTLDTTNWNLSNLKYAQSMFYACIRLTTLDTTNWNLSSLTLAPRMFFGCENLTNIDVSRWDTSNMYVSSYMFYGCKNLTNIDVSRWDTSNMFASSYMFYGCKNLTNIDVSRWDTSNMYVSSYMFSGCKNLTNIDVSNWDTSNMFISSYMFYGCESLTNIDVSKWDTSKNIFADRMFSGCKNLTNIDVSNWDTSNMYISSYMFSGCESLTNIDVSKWDTSNLKYANKMFNNCAKLETVDMSGWTLKEGTSINHLFSIQEGDTSKTKLLVIAKDPALINYDYKADSRMGCKITLDANGGIFNDTSSIKESDELFTIEDTTQEQVNDIVNNLMEIPTREGYTFKGWETSVTENDTIYRKLNASYKAIWEAEKPETPDDTPVDKPETPEISPSEDKNGPKIALEYNSNNWTNKPIIVKVKSSDKGSGVVYIQLPNGEIINSDSVEYTIKTNGTYEFKSADKSGNVSSKVITIKNIDTTAPEVTHSITNSNSEAIISILAKDKQSGVKKITSNTATYLRENTFIAKENGIYTFNIEDNAGNKIEYTVEVSYLSNIKPDDTETNKNDTEADKDDTTDTGENKKPEIHINDKVEHYFENLEEQINDIVLEDNEESDIYDTLDTHPLDNLEDVVTSGENDNASKSIDFISEEEYKGSDTSKKASTKTFTEIFNLPKLKIKTDKKANFIENVLYAPIEIEFKDITVYDAPNIKKVPLSSRTTTKENPKSNYKYITIRGEEHVNEKIKDVEFTNDSLTFVTTSGRVTLTIKEYYIMESIKEQLNNDEMKSSINTLSPEQVMDMLRVNKNRKHKPVEIDSYCVINNSKDSELDANFHMNLLKDNNTVEHSNTAIGTIKPNSSTKANSTLSIDTSNIDTGLYELEQTIDLSDGSTKKDTRKVALLSIRTYLMTFIIVGFILASITIYLSSKKND